MVYEYQYMTWKEIVDARDAGALFVLTTGAVEQHGAHLPMTVDHIIPYELMKQRLSKYVDIVLMPPIIYGYRSQTTVGGGPRFPFTMRMSSEAIAFTIRDIVLELVRHGVDKLLISDGHLENKYFVIDGIERALQENHSGRDIKVMYTEWNDYVKPETLDKVFHGHFPGFEYEHAAINETSLMLALRPDLVKDVEYPDEFAERYISYMVWPASEDLATKNGALSSAREACVETGELFIKDIMEGMLRDIKIEFPDVKLCEEL
ncbi:MAG: creatininase [Oscillospiraceae bacterium]|nr:creatininase [Oscillospiraceae bacterium]MBR2806357.1 creatininase [Oscillospiraceae bacterium]